MRFKTMWRQKHKNEHGTWDKKNLTPPSIKICPLFDELKKGDFFYPPPSCMDQCLLLSNFFFWKASLRTVRGGGQQQQRPWSNKTINCDVCISNIRPSWQGLAGRLI